MDIKCFEVKIGLHGMPPRRHLFSSLKKHAYFFFQKSSEKMQFSWTWHLLIFNYLHLSIIQYGWMWRPLILQLLTVNMYTCIFIIVLIIRLISKCLGWVGPTRHTLEFGKRTLGFGHSPGGNIKDIIRVYIYIFNNKFYVKILLSYKLFFM